MELGTSNIEAVYLGTTALDKMYLGTDMVFELGNKWKQPAYSDWTYTTGYSWDTSQYNTLTCDGYNASYVPNEALRGGSFWQSSTSSTPQWFGFYTESIKINSVLFSCPGGAGWVITAFDIEGSNDGSNWTTLGSYTRDSSNQFGIERYTIPAANRDYYQYHRIYITSHNGSGVSIGEVYIDADLPQT
jgi:hypothetical protein